MSDHATAFAELQRLENYLQIDPPNEQLRLRAIDLSLAAGDVPRARQHADAMLAAHPASAFGAHRHSHVLMAEGRPREAAEVLQTLSRSHSDVALSLDLALARLRSGEFAAAAAELKPYVQAAQPRADVLSLYAQALHRSEEFEGAMAACDRLAAHTDADAASLAMCSLIYLDADQLAAARRCSDAALASGARPAEALIVQGALQLLEGHTAEAGSLFSEVLANHPDEVRSLAGLGNSMLIAGNASGALAPLQRAAATAGANADMHLMLGWCHVLLKDWAQASDCFERAAALESDSAQALGGQAVVRALQGRRAESLSLLQRARSLDPHEPAIALAESLLSGAHTEVGEISSLLTNKRPLR